jgi:hypothetical protein
MVSRGRAKPGGIPLQLCFCLLSALVDDFDIIVEYRGDDRYHVGFHHSRPDVLGASDTDVENALERKIPLPHVHHVLTPALFEYAYQSFDTAIDGEDVPNAGGRCGEVCEMVERVDEGKGRGAVEGSAVVEGGSDADRGLIGVGDAEINLSHVCSGLQQRFDGCYRGGG